MQELRTTVTRILDGRRDAASAKRLWDEIWKAWEDEGVEGVGGLIDSMTALPDSEEEEEEEIDA